MSRIAQVAAQHSWHFCLIPECTRTCGFSPPNIYFSVVFRIVVKVRGGAGEVGTLPSQSVSLAFLLREQVTSTPNIAL